MHGETVKKVQISFKIVWKDNIEMDSKETCREIVGRINLARIGTSSLVVSRVISLTAPFFFKKKNKGTCF